MSPTPATVSPRFLRARSLARSLGCAWVIALGCEPRDPGGPVSNDDEPTSLRAEEVAWIAHTIDDGDALGDEGFTGVYDLGIEFEVDRAWWVHYSAALIPCDEASTGGARRNFPLIRDAHAGHSDAPDGSTLATSVATPLSPGRSVALGTSSFTTTRYCGLHLLAARADDDTLHLEQALDLLGATILLHGRYRHAATNAWTEFSCATDAPIGAILPLDSTWFSATASDEDTRWEITLSRRLATALDGVDPATDDADTCGRAVLANLFSDDAIEVRVAPLGTSSTDAPATTSAATRVR